MGLGGESGRGGAGYRYLHRCVHVYIYSIKTMVTKIHSMISLKGKAQLYVVCTHTQWSPGSPGSVWTVQCLVTVGKRDLLSLIH